jgi:hypothetical protein
MYFLARRVVPGNILGNTARPFLLIARRGDPLPPVALLRVRLEPSVHLRHHRDVAVPELASDELEGGAGARHPNGPVVPRIVQPVALEPERPEPRPVRGAHGPAIQAAEDTLTREHRSEVLGDEWPRPVRHTREPVARPCFGAPGTYLAGFRSNVGIHEPENGAHLESRPIGERVDEQVDSELAGSLFPGGVANLQKLTIGETFTIVGAIFLAAAWRPR